MNKRQEEILRQVAERHGLKFTEAREIWDLFTDKIHDTISEQDKKGEDGLYDIDRFPTIHISNFGKFVPNARNIRHANMCLKEKENDKHRE
jgi:nucleoid DNA-binding protein